MYTLQILYHYAFNNTYYIKEYYTSHASEREREREREREIQCRIMSFLNRPSVSVPSELENRISIGDN